MGGVLPMVLVLVIVTAVALAVRPSATSRRPEPAQRPALTPTRRLRHRGRRPDRPADHAGVDVLVDLLDEIGRGLRTGSSLAAAVDAALADRPALLTVRPEPAATAGPRRWAVGSGAAGSDVALVAHALTIAARTGGPAVAALDRAAAALRERRSWRAERRVQAAQARLGASVMTMVPLGFAVWSASSSDRVRDVYTASPVAVVLAAVGVSLNAIGWWWMWRITDGTVT